MLEKVIKLKKPLMICMMALFVVVFCRSFFIEPLSRRILPAQIQVDSIQWEGCAQVGENSWDYTVKLPTLIASDEVVSIMACWVSAEVYVDDTVIFTFDDTYHDKGTARLWIHLPLWAAGRTMHVVYTGDQTQVELSASETTYFGNASLVFLAFIADEAYALVFATSVLLMLLLIGYFYRLMRRHMDISTKRALLDLALFMIFTGIWILGDSKLMFVVSRNVAGNTMMTYSAVMLFPMFLVMFVSELTEHRLKLLDVLPVLFLIDCIVMDVGYLTRTIAPNKCLNSVHLLMGISMIAVIGGGIWDVRKNQNSEMRRLLAGFVCFAFFGILSIVQYRFSRVSNYPMYCCIGLLIFMLFIIWAAYDKLYRVMDHNANVQAYRRLAYRDVMTGLGNRAAFMKDQEELPEDSMVGFVVMDINDLKHTNDQYGHQAGDEMICNVASCIEEVFRGHGQVYRIGGDEFVAIVRDVTEKLMDGLLGTLDQALEKKQQEQERPWKLRIAYGYAIQPTAAEAKNDYEELFKQADDRMYERKRRMKS